MRLTLVELNRFRSRRAIALLLVGVFALVAWMTVTTLWQTRPVSSTEVAAAKQQAEQQKEYARADHDRCLKAPEEYAGPGATAEACQSFEPDYRWFLQRVPLSLADEKEDTGKAAILLMVGVGIIIGATFAGGDWSSGSVSNQLLFRPRRLPVWFAKAIAVTVGVLAAAAVLLALMWTAYRAAAGLRDIPVSGAELHGVLGQVGRGLALIGGGALGGYALTMLLRSTVGTIALLFAYLVGGEALISTVPIDHIRQWSLSSNVFAWLDKGHDVYDESVACPTNGDICTQTLHVSMTHGAVYLGVLLLLVVVVSAAAFQRRDVP